MGFFFSCQEPEVSLGPTSVITVVSAKSRPYDPYL
jgi:hypothetical protein